MKGHCEKQYDYWGYFWVALLAVMGTLLFIRNHHEVGAIKAQAAVASERPNVAPIQTVTQNAAPINIVVTTAPPIPAPIVKVRTVVVNRYIKPRYMAHSKTKAKPVRATKWRSMCYECHVVRHRH